MEKKLLELFMKRNCKILMKKKFIIGKVIKRNRNKLFLKREGCDNSFNSWIDKSNLI